MSAGKERILTRNFILSFIAQLCLSLGMYVLLSTLAEYTRNMGVSYSLAGAVTGIFIFGGFVSRLWSGDAMVRYGWKLVGCIFAVIHLIAACFYGCVHNIPLLLLVRFIHGLGFGTVMNAVIVIGTSDLPRNRYAEGCGYFMMSTSLGVAMGSFLGGLIYDHYKAPGCFSAAIAFAFIIAVSVFLTDSSCLPEAIGNGKVKGRRKFRIEKVIEKKAVSMSLCMFCLAFGYAALMSFCRLYMQQENLMGVFRYFFLVYAAVLLLSRPMIGRIQDRFGDDYVCYPCVVAQVLGLVLVAWKPCAVTVIAWAIGAALGYGTMNAVYTTIINKRVPPSRRTYGISTFWIFSDFAVGIAPATLGFVISAKGYGAMYFAAAAISACAIPVYWFFWGRRKIRY